jgi:hypothetical protein
MFRIGNVVKKNGVQPLHIYSAGGAIEFRSRTQDGCGIVELGEDRVGGAGGLHAAGVELLRCAAAQEQVLRRDLEHNL